MIKGKICYFLGLLKTLKLLQISFYRERDEILHTRLYVPAIFISHKFTQILQSLKLYLFLEYLANTLIYNLTETNKSRHI